MSTLNRFTVILSIIVLAACSVAPKTPLAANREKWAAQGITHYSFNLIVGCFCAFRSQMPLAIEVNDGKVVSIVDNAGQPVDQFADVFDKYNTIEKLFNATEAAQNGGAEKTTVEYNAEKGYPESVYIDYIEQAVDDEISLTVSNFTALP